MTVWLVRAGKHGERESFALERGLVVVGWDEVPDISRTPLDQLLGLLEQVYPDDKRKTLISWAGQLGAFAKGFRKGDIVGLPLKARPAIAFGEVTGPYSFVPDHPPGAHHVRPVKWLKEIPRASIDTDLLHSFGSALTICKIQRNQAEERIRKQLGAQSSAPLPEPILDSSAPSDVGTAIDLAEAARDEIRDQIARKFSGHALAGLVADVLRAQGYQVRVSPAGADGGVDILAGLGPMGFDAPRLAVQVKSGDAPMDVKVLRELQGVMSNFGAEQGLFVAWGGFKDSVHKEAARLFFQIRLWNADDLMRMIEAHYDDLPESVQAVLPMKRIWILENLTEED